METFKVGDIVRLKSYPEDVAANYGYIFEIKPKTKYPWNLKIIFFDIETVYNKKSVLYRNAFFCKEN
jgi:hypothetical protein